MRPFLSLTAACAAALCFSAGCSRNDRYSLEREYWKLGRMAKHISDNPDAAPWSEVERVVRGFEDFRGRCPYNALSVNADLAVARIYIDKKEPEMARRQLEAVVERYSSAEIKAEAIFMAGSTYEAAEWEKALEYYGRVRSQYPLTRRGMGIPLYLAEHYRDTFQPDKMTRAYRDAIGHYQGIAQEHPGSRAAFEARLMLSSCFGGLQDWRNSVKTLEELVAEFKTRAVMDSILMNIALIYRDHLKDAARYRDSLERLEREYPASPLAKTAKALMKKTEDDGKPGTGD